MENYIHLSHRRHSTPILRFASNRGPTPQLAKPTLGPSNKHYFNNSKEQIVKKILAYILLSILSAPTIGMDYSMRIFDGERIEKIDDYTKELESNSDIALLLAVQNNNKQKVEQLVASGVNVNLEFIFDNPRMTTTPLACAAGLGFTELAELLLSTGASLNGCSGDVPAIKPAMQRNDKKMVALLIAYGAQTTYWHSKLELAYQRNITKTSWGNWIIKQLMELLPLPRTQIKSNTY